MLRRTLLTSVVASASFVGTLVFAPAVTRIGERLATAQSETEGVSAPALQAKSADPCRSTAREDHCRASPRRVPI